MNKADGLRAWLVAKAVRLILSLMQIFPLHFNLSVARHLARWWSLLMPRHRHLAVKHLSVAYRGEKTWMECVQIARQCLEHWTMFAVELICLPRLINRYTWGEYILLVNFKDALSLLLEGRGVIMVTGHYGSFEIIGHLLSALDFRMVAVMRPLDNVYLNRFIVDSRRTHGLELLDKQGASSEAEELLRDGALLGFIGDQDAGRKGIFVNFFGQPASTYKSIGLLAMATRSPIIVGYARRLERMGRYEVGATRIIRPEEWETQEDPLRWITQTYTSAIEEFIREEPAQYLWIHRRWKSQPRALRSHDLQEVAKPPTTASVT